MFSLKFLFLFAVTSVYAEGEFVILHSPKSLQFQGQTPLPQSVLKDVFFSVLGFSPKTYEHPWDGMSIKNILELPEALVSVAIESSEPFSSHPEVRFPLNADEDEETAWQAISNRLHARNNNLTLVRINTNDGLNVLGHSVLFGEIKPKNIDTLKHLNEKNPVDKKFIEEVQVLRGIAEKVDTTVSVDAKSDVYWFVVSGLNEIMKAYGKDSLVYREAVEVLNDGLDKLSGAFKNAYDGNVFVAAFTNDADKTSKNIRVRRADTAAQETTEKADDLNLSERYTDDYPIIFNIFLWFGVAFIFSLLAICIAIAEMDPGRDSIIYRMTSNRMKKDN